MGLIGIAGILGRGRIAESNTLSYIARKQSETCVRVTSTDKPVTVGVFPARETDQVLAVLRRVYPHIVPARDVLESSLCNINAMFHPQGVILNAGWIQHTGGAFRFYYDGVTPAIGRVILRNDQERLAVAAAYGLELEDFCTCLYRADTTTLEAARSGDPYRPARRATPTGLSRHLPPWTTAICTRISAPAFCPSPSWGGWRECLPPPLMPWYAWPRP